MWPTVPQVQDRPVLSPARLTAASPLPRLPHRRAAGVGRVPGAVGGPPYRPVLRL